MNAIPVNCDRSPSRASPRNSRPARRILIALSTALLVLLSVVQSRAEFAESVTDKNADANSATSARPSLPATADATPSTDTETTPQESPATSIAQVAILSVLALTGIVGGKWAIEVLLLWARGVKPVRRASIIARNILTQGHNRQALLRKISLSNRDLRKVPPAEMLVAVALGEAAALESVVAGYVSCVHGLTVRQLAAVSRLAILAGIFGAVTGLMMKFAAAGGAGTPTAIGTVLTSTAGGIALAFCSILILTVFGSPALERLDTGFRHAAWSFAPRLPGYTGQEPLRVHLSTPANGTLSL